jgi:phage protein D
MSSATHYALTINDAPVPAAVLSAVKQIEVEDHASMADMMRLRLATAVRSDGSGWTVLDDTIFTRLAKLRLSVAVGSAPLAPLLEAYVVEVNTTFASDPGGSEIVVTAMDPTVLMHLEEKVRSWPDMADSDVALAIFSDAGYRFSAVVEPTGLSRQENDHTLVQRGTDIQFLQKLAQRNGYECYVEINSDGEVVGHFHPPKPEGAPQGTLTVNSGSATNVDKFRARYDMLGPAVAQGATIDADSGSTQPGDATEAAHTSGMGAEVTTAADRPRKVLLSGLGMTQSAEVQRYAQAVVDRSSWSIHAEGELSTVGYGAVLHAKQPVMVRGVGQQFSGRYYVERVLHTITGDGAWTQKFTLHRNAIGLTKREDFRSDNALAS